MASDVNHLPLVQHCRKFSGAIASANEKYSSFAFCCSSFFVLMFGESFHVHFGAVRCSWLPVVAFEIE